MGWNMRPVRQHLGSDQRGKQAGANLTDPLQSLPPMTLAELDEISARHEREWGVDRLPRLVSPETAKRWEAATALLADDFPPAGQTLEAVRASIARGWAALAQEARQRGHEPLPPACHEIPLEGLPGAVAAVCLDDTHAQALILRAKAEGRTVSVWTLAEVVRVIQSSEVVNQTKHLWPGATVQAARRRTRALPEDEIPFGGDQ